MLERGHTLRFYSPSLWREVAGHGATLFRGAAGGFGLGHSSSAKLAGLGTRLSSLKPGDAAVALDMTRGKFSFSGATINAIPAQIFNVAAPNATWAASLQNLGWLQHFVASDQELHRIVARSLIVAWGRQRKFWWPPTMQFRALMSLSLAAHFLVGKRPSSFEAPLGTMVEKLVRCIAALRPRAAPEQLLQALSLQYASLAFRGSPALRDQANAMFCAIINEVILPDGGHVSRSPLALLESLMDIIPVKDAMIASHEVVPQPLTAAIERMVPMLRMLSHGDHALSHFQGGGATHPDWINAILAHDKVHGRPLLSAPHSGYCRLAHGSGLVILDVGIPRECNSPLAFEFSDGTQRLVSNCGMPASASPAWQTAAADMAAHNTLEVAGFSQDVVNSPQGKVTSSPLGSLAYCHNQISGRSGKINHERTIFLSQNGRDLRGEDRIIKISPEKLLARNLDFTIRFHLHPSVKISAVRNAARVGLVLPNKTVWQFSARGGDVTLEDSVFLGHEHGPKKTRQIVVRGSSDSLEPVKWAFRRLEKASSGANPAEDTLRLPF